MTVSLGTIQLSDHLLLDGIENAPAGSSSARRTLGGRMVVQVGAPNISGRELTLSGENHFTLGQIMASKGYEASRETVTLTHHRGTFAVIVIAVEADPAIRYADPESADWYSCTITMIEV